MIRILMVTHYYDSHQGGIELVARNLFDGLTQRKFEVEWAAADVSSPPVAADFGSALPLKSWNAVEKAIGVPFPVPSPSAAGKLRAAMKRVDVVLLHDCLYLTNITAFILARLRGVPVIIVQHIGMVPYKNPMLKLLMKLANVFVTRPMLARASQVVFISDITRRYFGSVSFRVPPMTIFNGVDTEIFHPVQSAEEKIAVRQKLGLPLEGRVVLFVGRFVEKKGLRILKEMTASEPAITWAFAGRGPLDPAGWNFANARVYSELRGEGIAELYRASDILVLPSTGEGLPLVLQEALASGLPIVCSDETVTADRELARFVRGVALSEDASASGNNFLAAIRELLSQPAPAEAARARHEFVRDRYSWRHAVDQYSTLIASLQSGRGDVKAETIPSVGANSISLSKTENDS
ncbi:MAG: glycosyltransferase family 4 protein [Terriglobales bacterium]